jgi:hypothetical protein
VRGLPRELASRYVQVRSPRARWVARRDCAGAIERGEADFLLVDRPGAPARAGSGRAASVRFVLASQAAMGKRAVHGGLLAPLLGRLYLGMGRASNQVLMAERLRSAGVPTPEILAVGAKRVAGPLCAHAIVSRELPGARNLLEVAEGAPSGRVRRELLVACAELVRRMHEAGFLHADLNVGNLVLEQRDGVPVLNVVDLDRGRFRKGGGARRRREGLARLLRSYEKWIAPRLRLTGREEILFLRHYAGADRALLRRLARSLSCSRWRTRLRRIGRRLPAPRSAESRPRPPQ